MTISNSSTKKSLKVNSYETLTYKIIDQLERGIIPWEPVWLNSQHSYPKLPRNGITDKLFRGVNIVLLWSDMRDKKFTSHEWASFEQWNSKKQSIRKGEKGTLIVESETYEKHDTKQQGYPRLKTGYVFNRNQLLSPTIPEISHDIPVETKAERLAALEKYISFTDAYIVHRPGSSSYRVSENIIFIPEMQSFQNSQFATGVENYYGKLLYQLMHWTGHPDRLDRKESKFGSQKYEEEKLSAELGTAFLSSEFNLVAEPIENRASYLANCLNILKENKHCIVSVSREAMASIQCMSNMQPLLIKGLK